MHLLVPFAAPMSEDGRQALQRLRLPRLAELLSRLQEDERDSADELSLSPPHERALARAAGITGADGALPIAAIEAARAGIDPGTQAWGLVTPAHWRVGAEQVALVDPGALDLDESTSRALLQALRDLFESAGFTLHYLAPASWLASHPSFDGLPCAAVDRAVGRPIDRWLAPDPRARLVRRLQNEAQMLLHGHPINEAREARGELVVNSFWLSGCGVAPQARWPADLVVDDRLRSPLLDEDWPAWSRAWHALDAGPVADLLAQASGGDPPPALTLCGERAAATYRAPQHGLLGRLRAAWRRPDVRATLEGL